MTQNKVGHFSIYFRRMIKFYDLKANAVPKILFILLLAVSFGFRVASQPVVMDYTIYFEQLVNTYQDVLSSGTVNDASTFIRSMMDLQNSEAYAKVISLSLNIIGIIAIQRIILNILLFFYLGAYLCDLESNGSSFAFYIRKFAKALPRYLAFNLIFYLALILLLFAGAFIFALVSAILPIFGFLLYLVMPLLTVGWFIIDVIFVFKNITFLDTGVSVWRNFKISAQLSYGNRMMIARNIFFIEILKLMIGMFTVESRLVSMFIISFFEVIILLIRQRLVALMYLSRTRKIGETTSVSEI